MITGAYTQNLRCSHVLDGYHGGHHSTLDMQRETSSPAYEICMNVTSGNSSINSSIYFKYMLCVIENPHRSVRRSIYPYGSISLLGRSEQDVGYALSRCAPPLPGALCAGCVQSQ